MHPCDIRKRNSSCSRKTTPIRRRLCCRLVIVVCGCVLAVLRTHLSQTRKYCPRACSLCAAGGVHCIQFILLLPRAWSGAAQAMRLGTLRILFLRCYTSVLRCRTLGYGQRESVWQEQFMYKTANAGSRKLAAQAFQIRSSMYSDGFYLGYE
jgi:hypothetical protein